ncbi:MAG TPA: RagB/SusD family nutrient uptake outer membrane protein [Gemmatimonadaceae bacterium]|nr:RagB/SusD family nutrient uptake outer membrane protein [Gemmatimonadaceae bacterium]
MRNKILLFLAAAALSGCSEVLDVRPTSSVPAEVAITDAAGARAAQAGMYAGLQAGGLYGHRIIDWTELMSDNARFTGTFDDYKDADNLALRSDNNTVALIWNAAYNTINRANQIIKNVPSIATLSDTEKNQIVGEAYFIRALMYHDLVRLFGGVPLRTEPVSSAADASTITRATAPETYTLIMADIAKAKTLVTAPKSQTRKASLGAVYALEARVRLYQADYAGAEAAAAQVEALGYSLAPNFSDLFEATGQNTPEDIFRVEFTPTQAQSLSFYYLPKGALGGRYEVAPTIGPVSIVAAFDPASNGSIATYAPTDRRGIWSISRNGTRAYVSKFRNSAGDEDLHVIRLGEVILIRAEALARLGRLPEAVAEYNRLRVRAGLAADPTTGRTQQDVLDAIARERRLELAFEGDRWPDLIRMGQAPAATQGSATQSLLPIPQQEIETAPGITQNTGY